MVGFAEPEVFLVEHGGFASECKGRARELAEGHSHASDTREFAVLRHEHPSLAHPLASLNVLGLGPPHHSSAPEPPVSLSPEPSKT